MKLSSIGSNQTEVILSNETRILFSYSTPVAAWIDGEYFKTDTRHSNTTQRHINAWAHLPVVRPQSFFDELSGS